VITETLTNTHTGGNMQSPTLKQHSKLKPFVSYIKVIPLTLSWGTGSLPQRLITALQTEIEVEQRETERLKHYTKTGSSWQIEKETSKETKSETRGEWQGRGFYQDSRQPLVRCHFACLGFSTSEPLVATNSRSDFDGAGISLKLRDEGL